MSQDDVESTPVGQEGHKAEELIENLTPEEKKKWSEKFLQLEYYKAISTTVLQVFKDFSKWTALMISGVGTLVGGWFSIRKTIKKSKIENKSIEVSNVPVRRSSSISKENNKQYKEGIASVKRQDVSHLLNLPVQEIQTTNIEQEHFYTDTTMMMTIVCVLLFIVMNIKMFVFDKKKKKTEGQ